MQHNDKEGEHLKIGIIGAGTMGSGIAQVFAQCESIERVYLTDMNNVLAQNGKDKIEKNLSYLVIKERIKQNDKDRILGKIQTGLIDTLRDADLVLEAVTEDRQIKKKILTEVDHIILENAILASNTSSLSITELGIGLIHPLVGMHFFNPASKMNLVELISGINTPERIVDEVEKLSIVTGKTPIRVNESPGFVVNRLLIPMINEAIFVLSEGVANAEDIDEAMKLGANHPMGPLALGDLIGLDVVLSIMEVLANETGDSKYRPAPLLRKMVRGGKLGRNSGEGFYKYN